MKKTNKTCWHLGIRVVINEKRCSGVAWGKNKKKLYEISNQSTPDAVKKYLFTSIENALLTSNIKERIAIPDIDSELLKGLVQLDSTYQNSVIENMTECANNWKCEAVVHFGIEGNVSSGESGKPNYQISATDGKNNRVFRGNNHEVYDDNDIEDNKFDPDHISDPFSLTQLETLWSYDFMGGCGA